MSEKVIITWDESGAEPTPAQTVYDIGYEAGRRGKMARDFLDLDADNQFLSINYPEDIVMPTGHYQPALVAFFAGLLDGNLDRLTDSN